MTSVSFALHNSLLNDTPVVTKDTIQLTNNSNVAFIGDLQLQDASLDNLYIDTSQLGPAMISASSGFLNMNYTDSASSYMAVASALSLGPQQAKSLEFQRVGDVLAGTNVFLNGPIQNPAPGGIPGYFVMKGEFFDAADIYRQIILWTPSNGQPIRTVQFFNSGTGMVITDIAGWP